MDISIETRIKAPVAQVWAAWNDPHASVDLREDGRFNTRMEARDGSAGFDFEGTYTHIEPQRLTEYTMSDQRRVRVQAAGGQVHKPKFSIGPYGSCALVVDTEGTCIGLHSMA